MSSIACTKHIQNNNRIFTVITTTWSVSGARVLLEQVHVWTIGWQLEAMYRLTLDRQAMTFPFLLQCSTRCFCELFFACAPMERSIARKSINASSYTPFVLLSLCAGILFAFIARVRLTVVAASYKCHVVALLVQLSYVSALSKGDDRACCFSLDFCYVFASCVRCPWAQAL